MQTTGVVVLLLCVSCLILHQTSILYMSQNNNIPRPRLSEEIDHLHLI